ncbi:MAG: T9SS type A sorting domain-containing protein [Chitinophagales bacterium]|nr:T9SS type A sorting domain-containing protein [Chitinophagales bacterium]
MIKLNLHPVRISTMAFLFFVSIPTIAQKEDYNWLSGYNSNIGYDTGWGFYFGTSILDFNNTPVAVSYDSLEINFYRTNTSYSSNDGTILFYTNGVHIRNSLNKKIQNADSINWGPYITNFYPPAATKGHLTTQGVFAFQSPSAVNQYYIINTYLDTVLGGSVGVTQIRYHLLDMDANAGHGLLIERDLSILDDLINWEMTAVRHGNGRDWWIISRKTNSNCYHRLLLDHTGLNYLPNLYCGGTSITIPNSDVGAFAASPDGSRVAHFSIFTGINIFDFDRCSGELSNPINIPVPNLIDSGFSAGGAAISPNGRFLYIGIIKYVLQYDLQAPDIAASVDTVAVYDGYQSPIGSVFYTMQLGPDGKIYESCGATETVYHVINYPDKKGDSCGFVQHGIQLPSPSGGVPNFPNYRLGALSGSACDTLGTGLTSSPSGRIEVGLYPNPATEFVVIDYATAADWSKGELHLYIYDTKGAVIHKQPLPMYSGFQKIACTQWPNGVYQATIKRGETTIATGRVVKN